jgi:hypothetical protein
VSHPKLEKALENHLHWIKEITYYGTALIAPREDYEWNVIVFRLS